MPKKLLGINVLQAAQKRIEWTFDNFDKDRKYRIKIENFSEDQKMKKLKEFLANFSSLLKGIDIKRVGINRAIIIPLFDLLRRLLMALSFCFLYKQPIIVILILISVQIIYLSGHLHIMAFQSKQD